MSRKLILCLDGTSNRYCRDNTNVVKLAALLDKNATDQLLYYQPGIGTIAPPGVFTRTWRWFLTRLDLAFAILLKQHVQDAYRFLMRTYELGDEIYIFGFSRGAYTARVLAGMVSRIGLLQRGNEELVSFAWDEFERTDDEQRSRGFRNTFSRRVKISLLGLWDTVSSVRYGGRDRSFPLTYSNPDVLKVRHAVALDERRAYFRQNLWVEPAPAWQDVKQVWFPGVHCDVGGGYIEEESGLSKIALQWMVQEVSSHLKFYPRAVAEMIPARSTRRFAAPDAQAKQHESLRGWWRVVEFIPKRVGVRQEDGSWKRRWTIPRGRPRWVAPDAQLHESVLRRMADVPDYRPRNLREGHLPEMASSPADASAEPVPVTLPHVAAVKLPQPGSAAPGATVQTQPARAGVKVESAGTKRPT